MVISHNMLAMNAERQLGIVDKKVSGSTEKLTSGYHINRAADNAAGLSISEKMRKQIRGLTQASENAQDGISMVQTADGALEEVQSMLHRMNELAVKAANGTNSDTDRGCIQDEIDQLKAEVDRIATTAKFNEIYLLDGTLADPARTGEAQRAYTEYMEEAEHRMFATELTGTNKGGRIALDEINSRSGLKIVYTEITDEVTTTQTGSEGTGLSGGAYEDMKNLLKTEIVPQAVLSLLNTYPDTYGYLSDSSIGIGLYLYADSSSSTLASVTVEASASSDGSKLFNASLTYKLSVNVNPISGAIDLNNSASRDALEVTIIHEMTHALMDEVLTNGMVGYGGGANFDSSVEFPGWFKEGMAQASSGGCFNGSDWVKNGLDIDKATSEADIAVKVQGISASQHESSKLGSDTNTSKYATGYLACMYLGYLVNGGGTVNRTNIARGIDKLLGEIRGSTGTTGKSLEDMIKDYTSYNGIADFQNRFGDAASSAFIAQLMNAVGDDGTGGLAAGFSSEGGILPNTPASVSLFELDIDHGKVKNEYPSDYQVLSGGTATTAGAGGGAGGGTGGGTGGTGGTPVWKEVTLTDGLELQVGADSGNRMKIYIEGMRCDQIGIQNVDVTNKENATRSIDMVAFALQQVSTQRSLLGAYQNRLEHTIRNLDNVVENTQAAESTIRDTDMAEEMVKYSNNQILQQAGQAMLAQAKQSGEGVLKLLQ